MSSIVRLAIGAAILCAALSAAPIVQYDVVGLGGSAFQYSYTVSGVAFQQNQALEITFPAALFGSISNGVAPSNFSVLLLQPNNPPAANGIYSALALINNPSLAGAFKVDATYLGPGTPGAQSFSIVQYDATGAFVGSLSGGTTTARTTSTIPEPSVGLLSGFGLCVCGVLLRVRRRTRTLDF